MAVHAGAAAGAVLGGGVLGFVAPMIALLARGGSSPTIRAHAVSALNFFIPLDGVVLLLIVARICLGATTYGLGATALSGLVWLAQAAAVVVGAVFGIVGALRAADGEVYRYPVSHPFVR